MAPFSTTSIPKSDAMASPAPAKEYDHEIVDMASYIHNYKIDSDLALALYSSTLSGAVSKPSNSLTAPSSSVRSLKAPRYPMAHAYRAHHTNSIPSLVPSTLAP
ncbi:hypothetical protein LTR28_008915 [Elasticomyces elasticus]|nr:hypothetical protein LTR28_008915 [Elasticomyces elasticus]